MVIAAAEQSGELASGRVAWRGAIAAKHALDRQYDTGLGSRVASEIRFMQFLSFCRVNGNTGKRGGGEACAALST